VQFSLRSLLIAVTVAGVFTMPAYRYSIILYERWSEPVLTNVQVPDGGILIIGGHKWAIGKTGEKTLLNP